MQPKEVESLLSHVGPIGRIFFRPEKPELVDKVKRPKFRDGWVEFLNKTHAKRAVELLNAEPMGKGAGKQWETCLWNLRYLHKFTWKDLTGYQFVKDYTARKRIQKEVLAARHETQNYIDKVVMKRRPKDRKRDKTPAATAKADK